MSAAKQNANSVSGYKLPNGDILKPGDSVRLPWDELTLISIQDVEFFGLTIGNYDEHDQTERVSRPHLTQQLKYV